LFTLFISLLNLVCASSFCFLLDFIVKDITPKSIGLPNHLFDHLLVPLLLHCLYNCWSLLMIL
jgi:hypothetical protein